MMNDILKKPDVDGFMDDLKEKNQRICLVCGQEDDFNVCIMCDAKVTARKAYKRYFKNSRGIDTSKSPDYIKDKEKNYYRREARKYYAMPGMGGLTQEERQKFFRIYEMEFDHLKDDFDYMCKVLRYMQDDKGDFRFQHDDSKYYDELKYFYRHKLQ